MNRLRGLSLLSSKPTPDETAPDFCLELRIGRLRRIHAGVVIGVGVAAGWLWMGSSGASLLGLWAWSSWPEWHSRRIRVQFSRLRYARFSTRRVFWVEQGGQVKQVFIDEVCGAQYAALRRELKSTLLL